MKVKFLWASFVLLLGCQQAPLGQQVEQANTPSAGSTANPVTPLNSPLTIPLATPNARSSATPIVTVPQAPIMVPTPSPGRAVVIGKLRNLKSVGVVASIRVFLARIYYSADGSSAAFGLDIRTSPRAVSEVDGSFVFADVEPGEYLLMVGDPTLAGTVKYSDAAGKDVVLKVSAGQTLNIGEAKVSS